MITVFFIANAFGAEPPPLPESTEPVPGQCAQSYALQESTPIPNGVIDGQVASCGGVLVPTSEVADLINYRTYATALNSQYRLDTEDLESQLRVLQAENDSLKRHTPWIQTAVGQRWVGRFEVAAIVSSVLISAYYVDKASNK